MKKISRGSEWRQWDLHVHSPASFEWQGQAFEDKGRSKEDKKLLDEMVSAFNNASPEVFAIMDYWTFDGWLALQEHLKTSTQKLHKTVFPGIEIRIVAPMPGRLNAHAIFSNKITEQQLKNFLSHLRVHSLGDGEGQPLSEEALIEYARKLPEHKLKMHGVTKKSIKSDSRKALEIGQKTAEITFESYLKALESAPANKAISFVAFSTNDGLKNISLQDHYGYATAIFRSAFILETRVDAEIQACKGCKTPENEKFFDAFQEAMNYKPKLAVAGSDAHRFIGEKQNNNKRGYGDFASGKITWIKSDPTWEGLLQVLKEPRERSFIGEIPPKMEKIKSRRTDFIDIISIQKEPNASCKERWFENTNIPLSSDLVAIIGNKGSGKSALADIIAHLGHTHDETHFSFLKKGRFLNRGSEPAKSFFGTIKWLAGTEERVNLAASPDVSKKERVKYIPQDRFEDLCNNHVSGQSTEFEQELRAVVFSHIPEQDRLGTANFNELLTIYEDAQNSELQTLRSQLHTTNIKIISLHEALKPSNIAQLEDALSLKQTSLTELEAEKPLEVPEPSEKNSESQNFLKEEVRKINKSLEEKLSEQEDLKNTQKEANTKLQAITTVLLRLNNLKADYELAFEDIDKHLNQLDIQTSQVLNLKITDLPIKEKKKELEEMLSKDSALYTKLDGEIKNLQEQRNKKVGELDEPAKNREKYKENLRLWKLQKETIEGTPEIKDSLKGIENQISKLKKAPEQLTELEQERDNLCGRIHDILESQRQKKETLFKPVQTLIDNHSLIRDEYKLNFKANLATYPQHIANKIFSIIKQNVGPLRGGDSAVEFIRESYDNTDFQDKESSLAFAKDICTSLEGILDPDNSGISETLIRKDHNAVEVYDFLFGLTYLQPSYTLTFQDTSVQQLSPGQRGALLLIFYLLVDQENIPIILDQPEENLDNETIVNLLVPVIQEAKKQRQVIMVTHNANLAVVCDAEQIISAQFHRQNGPLITYHSGSIEEAETNKNVVNILEGTKTAFDNRGSKYFSHSTS